MFELDVKNVRVALVKSVRLVVAVRGMFKPMFGDLPMVQDLEREIREAAGDVQKAEECLKNGLPVVLVKDWSGPGGRVCGEPT